jgi:hypothetical protein
VNAVVGTHPRNVEAMVRHRKDLHDAATRRTETVLDALEHSGAVITFQLVARRAGVSRSWLYKQEPLRERIATLRREHPRPAHASAERATDASKDAILRTLRQRLADEAAAKAKLVAENNQLRKINEVLAGQVHYCRTYHTANAPMASNYSGIVYHAPPTFDASEGATPASISSSDGHGRLPRHDDSVVWTNIPGTIGRYDGATYSGEGR